MKTLIRITTIPNSLGGLLKGQLQFMTQHYRVLGVADPGLDNKLQQVGQQEGVATIPVPMTRKITPLKDLKAVYQLYKLFKKEQPFIVHSHTPKAGTLGMIAAKLAGVPHRLHTIAGLPLVEATGNKRRLLNLVEKITYACATKIYPNAYGLVAIILENKFTHKGKLKVLASGSSNGIDTNHFDPALYTNATKQATRAQLNIQDDDVVYVFVGRMVADKGVNELVTAFNRLQGLHSNTKLLLVGDYETALDPLLPETLDIINTNPHIISTGWVNDVRPYFAIANILTFPSYREGFPNVVMQAGAMGLPAIVTNINGCNEIIIEGENGTIIPVKDSTLLYEKMKAFYIRPNQYTTAKCRQLIVDRYQRQKVWDAILEEYQQLT
ncbi:glycosyltransferase family 4 protein [Seonamhaeicola algicola]|uniref:Glycosyltransferase family 4 protein n=1 Tax=Seonamhaeicola algicola TaxID=1719036 RepID=A0A5C7ATM6_9FLAO|nr:glycosyltransferase family 4 protein [Seonamhaeicola algicola]TXE11667.1 glycosyltransferase family 4 protein [Seonamhaeicola algicola]